MVLPFNSTDHIGRLVIDLTSNVTGELFISLFLICLVIILIAVATRIPIEFTAILVLPLLIGVLSFESSFLAVAGVFFLYVSVILAKNFFFYK